MTTAERPLMVMWSDTQDWVWKNCDELPRLMLPPLTKLHNTPPSMHRHVAFKPLNRFISTLLKKQPPASSLELSGERKFMRPTGLAGINIVAK